MQACIYLCKNIIGGLNIGEFIQKSPIAKIYSSPIFCLIRYLLINPRMISRYHNYVKSQRNILLITKEALIG